MKIATLSYHTLAGTPDAEIHLEDNQELLSVDQVVHDATREISWHVVIATTTQTNDGHVSL